MSSVNVETVEVEKGDTLWKIAERELGAGKYWLNLYLMNAVDLATSGHKMVSAHIGPDWIYPGDQIKIVNGVPFEPSGN
jgi:nucleoid-associated protein YgaU